MTRSHVFVLALAASTLATFFASCCCGGGHRPPPPPPQKTAGAYLGHESLQDDGTPWPSGSGATNSTAHANGTFNYTTGLVLYDVSVDYVTWSPTKIEVWAAPTGTTPLIAPGNEILEEPPPSLPPSPNTWAQGISVPFIVGSSSYTIGIKVTFGPGQGYDLHRFTFSGLYVPVDG